MAIAIRTIGKYDTNRLKSVTWQDIRNGVKLKVRDREWFDKNCKKLYDGWYEMECTKATGEILPDVSITDKMLEKCGSVVTVTGRTEWCILVSEHQENVNWEDDSWCWYPEMFECVVK
jgi:hypothetical protein